MTAKPSADAKPAEAGRYGARRMTTTRRASRSGTRRTAGCWYAATPAATRSASSRRFERGLWAENSPHSLSRIARRTSVERKPNHDDARRSEAALAIWQSAQPAQGTPLETYLATRGIDLPPPDVLRFHAGLKHHSGGIWPMMVALVTNGADGMPVAIHRTYLARDGDGKAPIDPQKMMLGPCRGGAVRLAEAGDVLMIGEGVETCLAAMQASGHPAWAALSTSGLRSFNLPTMSAT
jgi:putative DNA primase/helicase